MSRNREVIGLNPAGCRAFLLLLLLSFTNSLHQRSVLTQVTQGGASLTVCCKRKKWMSSCAAWGKTGSMSSDGVKNFRYPYISVFIRPLLRLSNSPIIFKTNFNSSSKRIISFRNQCFFFAGGGHREFGRFCSGQR